MVVIARRRMALTLISHEELVSQEACLNFGVEDYDEEHPEQNWYFGINIKTCKILVEPLGQHGLFMVALFLQVSIFRHLYGKMGEIGGVEVCISEMCHWPSSKRLQNHFH